MFPAFIRKMADDLICDPKVSTLDYLFSSINVGDWYCMDDYIDMDFGDYLNKKIDEYLELKDDVVNKLPSDPFEMNVSGGCTMIRGWVQEVVNDDDDDFGYIKVSEKSFGDEFRLHDKDGFFLSDEKSSPIKKQDDLDDHDHGGAPHDALFFALGHLRIKDLVRVERVCKSLRDGIRDDPLLWRNIFIYQPRFKLFTDDTLLRITSRANGCLQSLSIIKCFNITDDGLKNVFQQNQGLTKLNVAYCNSLSAESLINNMKSLRGPGIKRLRIHGLNITMGQFQELSKLLSINNQDKPEIIKPRIYHGNHSYLPLDDNRLIDKEPCPRCHRLVDVYDCPAASCGGKHDSCRACIVCIPRCSICGCCLTGWDYIETFSMERLCFECVAQFLTFPDGEDGDLRIHEQASYFCVWR